MVFNRSQDVESMICPTCGEYKFKGLYDICPICGWENNDYQKDYPEDGGANEMSLNERIVWFKKMGAKNPKYHWERIVATKKNNFNLAFFL